jgi:hypothetical protein
VTWQETGFPRGVNQCDAIVYWMKGLAGDSQRFDDVSMALSNRCGWPAVWIRKEIRPQTRPAFAFYRFAKPFSR